MEWPAHLPLEGGGGVSDITSDATRIRLAAFQLEGEVQVWWKWARTSRDLKAMTWAEFQ